MRYLYAFSVGLRRMLCKHTKFVEIRAGESNVKNLAFYQERIIFVTYDSILYGRKRSTRVRMILSYACGT